MTSHRRRTLLPVSAAAVLAISCQIVPAKAATPTAPPPDVTVKPTREGVQGRVNERMIRRHKSNTPAKTTPAKHEPRSRPRRDSPPESIPAQLKLNLGICGRAGPDGTVPGPTRCQPFVPDRPGVTPPGGVVRQLPRPQDVTWEQILAEYKDVLFPRLGVKVQPDKRTLVNLETIVYTDENKVSINTVTLLGFPVVIEATPVSYSWNFGDGKTLTTTTPGRPYPSKEVSHKYLKRGDVQVSLTTNYAARYNVAGTGWQYVEGTVPIAGPSTALSVREAVPVLVDPSR